MRHIISVWVLIAVLLSPTFCFGQNQWNMELIGEGASDGRLLRYTATDNYLYIITQKLNQQRNLFTVVDIGDPARPSRTGLISVEDNGYNFFIADSLLFWVMFNGGAIIYNIQNPAAPVEIARFDGDRGFGNMKLFNGYIVSRQYRKLNIIDIQDPQNPVIVAQIELPYPIDIADFDFYGNYIVVTEAESFPFDRSYLEVYDVSGLPSPPQLIYSTTLDSTNSMYFKINVIDDYFYLRWFYGFSVYDISNPSDPQFLDTVLEN